LGIFGMENATQAAEQYPVKPISYIVAVEAGAGGDILARPLCQKVSTLLGQSVIVVNKPGAGSSIGYREIHDAKPDGYTIGLGMGTIITNKLQGLLPYDHHDFTLICVFYDMRPTLVASTKTQRPFKTIEELIAYAKSHPGELKLATGSVGQMLWYQTMAFTQATGLQFNIIPQPGAGGFAIAQVAGGHADLGVIDMPSAKTKIEAGNVRPLAVVGERRAPPPYDRVPALKELGYEINIASIGSVVGPPKMPKEITDKLVKVFKAANDAEYQKFVAERFVFPTYIPPEEAVKYLDEQIKGFRIIAEKAGILKESR